MSAATISRSVASIGDGSRRRLAGFARTLRDNGFKIGLAETRDALAILLSPAATRRSSLKPALRSLFAATRSDWERFDELFDAYWSGRGMRRMQTSSAQPGSTAPALRRLAAAGSHLPQGLPDHAERRAGTDRDNHADPGGRREGATRAENLAAADIRRIADADEIARVHALAARWPRRCGHGSFAASRHAGVVGDWTCAAPSIAMCRRAVRRSISSGVAER